MTKPVVHYSQIAVHPFATAIVGARAFIVPVDHSSPYVSNNDWATTSEIVKFDEATGIFETLNTVYVPA